MWLINIAFYYSRSQTYLHATANTTTQFADRSKRIREHSASSVVHQESTPSTQSTSRNRVRARLATRIRWRVGLCSEDKDSPWSETAFRTKSRCRAHWKAPEWTRTYPTVSRSLHIPLEALNCVCVYVCLPVCVVPSPAVAQRENSETISPQNDVGCQSYLCKKPQGSQQKSWIPWRQNAFEARPPDVQLKHQCFVSTKAQFKRWKINVGTNFLLCSFKPNVMLNNHVSKYQYQLVFVRLLFALLFKCIRPLWFHVCALFNKTSKCWNSCLQWYRI